MHFTINERQYRDALTLVEAFSAYSTTSKVRPLRS